MLLLLRNLFERPVVLLHGAREPVYAVGEHGGGPGAHGEMQVLLGVHTQEPHLHPPQPQVREQLGRHHGVRRRALEQEGQQVVHPAGQTLQRLLVLDLLERNLRQRAS
jgi:hypothetical protein